MEPSKGLTLFSFYRRWQFDGPLLGMLITMLGVATVPSHSMDFSARELDQGNALEREINAQRVRVGMPVLQPLNQNLQKIQLTYSDGVLDELLESANCDHDYSAFQNLQNLISKLPANNGTAIPESEVIGCPSQARNWSPRSMVERWEQSPHHYQILFERPNRSNIGCSVKFRGGLVASLCTLWAPNN